MITKRLASESEAAAFLKQGKLVAFPTETVFGLGADATNHGAVESIFRAKGRPGDNPLIVHLARQEDWPLAARTLTDSAQVLLAAFAPGPIAVVLPKARSIDPLCTAGKDTVAIRIPSCQITHRLLVESGIPVAAPSANSSGRPSPTTWQSVLEDLDGRIDAVLCHNPEVVGLESTVVDCCQAVPLVLRPGAITLSDIRRFFPAARLLEPRMGSEGSPVDDPAAGNSPGLRHPHYRPRATVHLFGSYAELRERLAEQTRPSAACALIPDLSRSNATDKASQGHEDPSDPISESLLLWEQFASIREYAAGFYEFLRQSDRIGAEHIFVQLVDDEGLGCALRDRQLRSAGQR